MDINQNIASGGLTLDGSTPPPPPAPVQTTPQPSPPQQSQPQQKGGVDRQALNLAHAIALAESGSKGSPNYNATGDNGTSHGAYQWNGAGHFASDAKSFGFDPNDSSPENQDKVAYAKIKAWKDQGYQPAEIASMWNSGSPHNWQNHSGTSTINGKAIHYDTPAYVQKVKQYYDQLSSSDNGYVEPPTLDLSSSVGNDPTPEAPAPDPTPAPKKGLLQKLAGFEHNTANAISDPFVKIIGGGVRVIQATPQLFRGDFKGASKTMATSLNDSAVTGQQQTKTAAGSTPLQNVGTAAELGSYLIPGGSGVVKSALQGAATTGLQSGGSYLSGTDNPTLKNTFKTTGEGALTGLLTGGVLGYGASKTPQAVYKTALGDIMPDYEGASAAQKTKFLNESTVAGKPRVQEGGLIGGRSLNPTSLEQDAAKTVSRNVPKYEAAPTFKAKADLIQQTIAKEGDKMATSLKNEGILRPPQQIRKVISSAVNKVPETSLLLQKSDPVIQNYMRVADNAINQADGTLAGEAQIRQTLDDAYKNARGKSAYGSDRISALDDVHTAARDALNQDIISHARNTDVKAGLKTQWDLFRAKDAITPKVATEAGSKLGRFAQRNPLLVSGIKKGIGTAASGTALGLGIDHFSGHSSAGK